MLQCHGSSVTTGSRNVKTAYTSTLSIKYVYIPGQSDGVLDRASPHGSCGEPAASSLLRAVAHQVYFIHQ